MNLIRYLSNKLTTIILIFCLNFQLSISISESAFNFDLSNSVPSSRTAKQYSVSTGDDDNFNLNTLRMVQVVFRHGDRTPLRTYPNDPYKDHQIYWPSGLGQLTEMGIDQHYDLGSYFRRRYDGFLSQLYSQQQMHALSSDTDRTLMSAEANAAGLFPKINRTLKASKTGSPGSILPFSFYSKIGVQLVPIHTITPENDKLLKMSAPCPRIDQAADEFFATSKEYRRLASENSEFIRFLEDKMGLQHSSNIFNTLKYHDPLFCQRAHGMTLPTWANDTVMSRIARLRGIGFAMASGTTELRRLNGGPLVKRFLDNMLHYEKQDRRKRNKKFASKLSKMYVHSGHDDTIAAVMTSMGVFDPQLPPYASAFIVELHQKPGKDEYIVQLFYRNSTTVEPYPLQVPGCSFSCPLTTLVELLKPVIPSNWDEECQQQPRVQSSGILRSPRFDSISGISASVGFIALVCIIAIVASSIVFVMVIYGISFFVQKCKRKNKYSQSGYVPI